MRDGSRHDRAPDLRTPGAPSRWAEVLAWVPLVAVVPSSLWRSAVGLGVDLGWSEEQLRRERIPGAGTAYVLVLSAVSIGAAALTLGLVRPWGRRLPPWVPVVGGVRVPERAVVVTASVGAALVTYLCVRSVVAWDEVSGFAHAPDSAAARFMAACYLPALLWPPALAAVTLDYWRRRP